jgi:Fic family protein
MKVQDFTNPTGRLVPTINNCSAFVPNPLPPPTLDVQRLLPFIARSTQALGELSGVGRTLANPYLLIRPFMRKEAVASSRIEGTVTNLSDLFVFEADERTNRVPADAREVLNYVHALEGALLQLEELPISTRLIRNAHERLLTGVAGHRGASIVPGEFRKEQNWIGSRLIQNARYVPPPHLFAIEAMSDLEKYINRENDPLPIVVRMALVHYQFEAIHPFPDGNGRVGRLLMPLMLCASNDLSQPLLYLSTFFERNYDTYIERMFNVSARGEWEAWIEFFLTAIEQVSKDAIAKVQALQDLRQEYLGMIQRARSSALLARVIDLLFENPVTAIPEVADRLSISYNASKNNVAKLAEHNIVIKIELGRQNFWAAQGIIDLIGS